VRVCGTGWTKAEVENLVIVLKKFGVGRWVQIVDSGALPGKQIQQLNGQTQRLLGKQSLAEYTGLNLDVLAVKLANEQLEDVVRKNGLITNQGGKMEKERLKLKREENLKLFGLSKEEIERIEVPKPVRDAGLDAEAYMGKNHNKGGVNGGLGPTKRVVNVETVSTDELNDEEKVEVLKQLRKRLIALRMQPAETSKKDVTTTANVVVSAAAKKNGDVSKGGATGKRAAPPTKAANKPAAKKTKAPPKGAPKGGAAKKNKTNNNKKDAVQKLIDMGFTVKMAKDAIEEADGDITAATEWLFANAT